MSLNTYNITLLVIIFIANTVLYALQTFNLFIDMYEVFLLYC